MSGSSTHIAVLVQQVDDPVGEVENVPPVEGGHAVGSVVGRPVVQEVKDVMGGEGRVLQGSVDEALHLRVTERVLCKNTGERGHEVKD